MTRVDSSREPERYCMTWPNLPIGLSKDQARNWFLQHRKPRTYEVERFDYNTKTGIATTFGYDKPCRS